MRILNPNGTGETTRFFQITDPAITRKRLFVNKKLKNLSPRIIKIQDLGYSEKMFDIQTATGNFIANGMISHNCHNKELQSGESFVDIGDIMKQILDNYLISEVIFSGGEPMLQPKAVEEIAKFCHSIGLKVGLETSGYNSGKLNLLMKEELIDEVFLDIKTYGERNYHELTGIENSFEYVKDVILLCMMHNIPLQVRTTIFPDYPDKESLEKIESFVKRDRLNWKKQEGRT
jgi:wyosine [tRNA(Phe)-imidazoG37] synthetase (radical SAM superfamily)